MARPGIQDEKIHPTLRILTPPPQLIPRLSSAVANLSITPAATFPSANGESTKTDHETHEPHEKTFCEQFFRVLRKIAGGTTCFAVKNSSRDVEYENPFQFFRTESQQI
jgi:hypothetical protein